MTKAWLLLFLLSTFAWAQPKLKVVVAGDRPFVVGAEGMRVRGLSPLIWDVCANTMGVTSDYEVVTTLHDALERVMEGSADVAVGPIAVHSRWVLDVDFTVAYAHAPLAVLVKSRDANLYERLKPLLGKALLWGGGSLLISLTGVGFLIWLLEHRRNPQQFPPNARHGVEEAVWFAVTTATSVGYGDRFPITRAGRLVTALWMIVAGIAFSTVTALLATAFTLSHLPGVQVRDLDDLRGLRVAVVKGSAAEFALRSIDTHLYPVQDLAQAQGFLQQGRVQLVVSSGPILHDLVRSQNLEAKFLVQEIAGHNESFVFALRKDSPWTRKVDEALLVLRESGEIDRLSRSWLDQEYP